MTLPRPDTEQSRRHALRFTHPDRWPSLARFPVEPALVEEIIAQMFACGPGEVRALVADQHAEVTASAARLLLDVQYARDIAALPFRASDRVVVVGDSVSADRLGWFELLTASLTLARDDAVVMVNQSISGDTTASAIERIDLVAAAAPDHVLIMLGTNDARRHGRGGTARMVSPQETVRNLRELADVAVHDLGARPYVITPPACDHDRIATFFTGSAVCWNGDEVDAIIDTVRALGPSVIDVASAMRAIPPEEFGALLEPDGIHPTVVGQQLLARRVAAGLAAAAVPADPPGR